MKPIETLTLTIAEKRILYRKAYYEQQRLRNDANRLNCPVIIDNKSNRRVLT
jgi:hypothetical protein